jgi:hypothetical protein
MLYKKLSISHPTPRNKKKVDFIIHPDMTGNFLMKSEMCCSVYMYREIVYVLSQSMTFLLCMTIAIITLFSTCPDK